MKPLISSAVILISFLGLLSPIFASTSRLQKFAYWGTLDGVAKLDFFLGFTNGLAASGVTKLHCSDLSSGQRDIQICIFLNESLQTEQAIAMIDKFYKEHPEEWNQPIGVAIIDALATKGAPCARTEQ